MARGQGTFGLSSSRGRGRGSFRAGYRGGSSWRGSSWRGGRGRGRGGGKPGDAAPVREDDGTQLAERFEKVSQSDEVDEKLGFAKVEEGIRKEGWLINMHPVSLCVLKCVSYILSTCQDPIERPYLAIW
jgi:DNA polymerase epsilon subunit 1